MSNAENTARLLEIACRAISLHSWEQEVKRHATFMNQAYKEWRDENGCEYVGKHSPEWDAMLEATRDTYIRLKAVKRSTYNAKRRLSSAIKRFGEGK